MKHRASPDGGHAPAGSIVPTTQSLKLSRGVTMSHENVRIEGIATPVSRIGLGTWGIGGRMWGGADDAASVATIRNAIAAPPAHRPHRPLPGALARSACAARRDGGRT